MMGQPRPVEPTGDQCNNGVKVFETETHIGYACWYPQMGGYVGKAVVCMEKDARSNSCFDVLVWHDGDWPFHDGEDPCELHHCCAEQFIEFGKQVLAWQGEPE